MRRDCRRRARLLNPVGAAIRVARKSAVAAGLPWDSFSALTGEFRRLRCCDEEQSRFLPIGVTARVEVITESLVAQELAALEGRLSHHIRAALASQCLPPGTIHEAVIRRNVAHHGGFGMGIDMSTASWAALREAQRGRKGVRATGDSAATSQASLVELLRLVSLPRNDFGSRFSWEFEFDDDAFGLQLIKIGDADACPGKKSQPFDEFGLPSPSCGCFDDRKNKQHDKLVRLSLEDAVVPPASNFSRILNNEAMWSASECVLEWLRTSEILSEHGGRDDGANLNSQLVTFDRHAHADIIDAFLAAVTDDGCAADVSPPLCAAEVSLAMGDSDDEHDDAGDPYSMSVFELELRVDAVIAAAVDAVSSASWFANIGCALPLAAGRYRGLGSRVGRLRECFNGMSDLGKECHFPSCWLPDQYATLSGCCPPRFWCAFDGSPALGHISIEQVSPCVAILMPTHRPLCQIHPPRTIPSRTLIGKGMCGHVILRDWCCPNACTSRHSILMRLMKRI